MELESEMFISLLTVINKSTLIKFDFCSFVFSFSSLIPSYTVVGMKRMATRCPRMNTKKQSLNLFSMLGFSANNMAWAKAPKLILSQSSLICLLSRSNQVISEALFCWWYFISCCGESTSISDRKGFSPLVIFVSAIYNVYVKSTPTLSIVYCVYDDLIFIITELPGQ